MLENQAQLAQLLEIAVRAEYVKVNDCDPTDNKGVLDPALHDGPGIFNVVAGDDYFQFTGKGLINGSWVGSQFHCKDHEGKLQVLTFLSAGKPLCPSPERTLPKQLVQLVEHAVRATHVIVNDYDPTENYSVAVPPEGQSGPIVLFLSPADENMVFVEEDLLNGRWINDEFCCENERDAVRLTFLQDGEAIYPGSAAIEGYMVRINPDYEAEDGGHFEALLSALEHFEIPASVDEVKAVNPRAFTVISVDPSTAQIYADHVEADNAMAAFTAATLLREEYSLDFVCAMKGHLSEGEMLFFPGAAVVDSETVLEQPNVFC